MIDKPYRDDDLWDAIRTALEREEVAWTVEQRRREICDRLSTLTSEERRVMELIVEGKPNKVIANELGLAIRTVEKRRHEVLAKMEVEFGRRTGRIGDRGPEFSVTVQRKFIPWPRTQHTE